MAPFFGEEMILIVTGLLSGLPSILLGIASYVLSSLAIYTIALRRGLRKPWLAWIPVVKVWLLGSISDQYRYVVKRQNTSRRKWLLILKFLKPVLTVGTIWFAMEVLRQISFGVLLDSIWDLWLGLFGCALPLAGCTIAYAVIRYIALYDVYCSLDPNNAVLYLVLSIFAGITEPFFLFFNRDKDKGMPPRKQEPVSEPPRQDTWENTEYL